MSAIVETRIVKFGNSHGIRIPKLLLEQAALSGQAEMEIQGNQFVVRPTSEPTRQGWEEQFKKMAEQGDDQLPDADLASSSGWDEDEWEW